MAAERDLTAGTTGRATAARRAAVRARVGHAVDVLLALAESDMRARYGRGRWQLIKWLADPFFALGVYLLLVTFVLDRGGAAPGLSLACAIVPFQVVMMSVTNGLSAISIRRAIVLNMRFDRTLIPVSSVVTESVSGAAAMTLLVAMMAVYGVAPTVALLWLPVVIVVTLVLAVAFAYPAVLIGVWFPELRAFAISLMRTLYFLAPGLVALAEISGRANELLKLNPLTGVFEAFRSIFLYGHRPAAWQLLVPLAFSVVVLSVIVPLYRREQRHFAKVVD